MKKRVKLIYLHLFVLGILIASGSFSGVKAQDNDDRWKLVVSNSTEEYYYDSVTVSTEGDTTIVWIKTVYKEKLKDEDGKLMKSAVNSLYLFCGKNKYTLKDVEVTYADGKKKAVDYEEKNKPIKPDSPLEKVYNIFCKAEE